MTGVTHGGHVDEMMLAADGLRDLAGRIADAGSRGDQLVGSLGEAWEGPDAAHFVGTWASSARPALDDAADRLLGYSSLLRDQADQQRQASQASASGGRPTGTGAQARTGPASAAGSPGRGGQDVNGSDRTVADAALPPGLGGGMSAPITAAHLPGPGGGDAPDGGRGAADLPPPHSASPREVTRWWRGLDDAERERILAEHPERIRNRDGIPYGVRHEANVATLESQREDLVEKRAELVNDRISSRKYGTGDPSEDATVGALDRKIASVDAVRETLEREDRQLVSLDLQHDRAQAVIANGDLDTADHVAVHVPGFSTTVDGSLASMDRADNELRGRMDRVLDRSRDNATTATVTWIGYQAPQVSTIPSDNSVAMTGAAREGGSELATFGDGFRSLRGHDGHLTGAAHSYGSTTASYAMQETDSFDDIVYFGSPGSRATAWGS